MPVNLDHWPNAFREGDRVMLKRDYPSHGGRRDFFSKYEGKVLIIEDLNNDTYPQYEGMPSNDCLLQYVRYFLIEETEERVWAEFASPDAYFEKIPSWEKVLGPLGKDLPLMTAYQFLQLDKTVELLKGQAQLLIVDLPWEIELNKTK